MEDHPWSWTPECQTAFQALKDTLSSPLVTAYPDFEKLFRLYIDASNEGLGAVLAQKQSGWERLVCCASRTLTKSE